MIPLNKKQNTKRPSLNTQSCIKGLLVVQDIWGCLVSRASTEKKIWANYEQLLGAVFYAFSVKKMLKTFENIVASSLKVAENEVKKSEKKSFKF